MGEYDPLWLEITGTLVPEGPFRIGASGQLDLYSDMPVLRYDGRHGLPWLPGTSIRGVLRAHLLREHSLLSVSDSAVKALFGDSGVHGSNQQSPKMGRLRVLDSIPTDTVSGKSSEIRDHVKINPEWGAAADRLKFDAEVMLQSQWEFPLHIIYEGPAPRDEKDMILLGEVLHAMKQGLIRIGGRSGIGMGRFKLKKGVAVRMFDRSTAQGLSDWLKYRLGDQDSGKLASYEFPVDPAESPQEAPAPALPPWHYLCFEIALHCEGPFLVKSAVRGQKPNPDAQPVTTGDGTFYLPGSSLRGVLRAHAYRIAHSQGTGEEPWLRLFGSVKDNQAGRKGLLEVQDGTVSGAELVCSDHVAVDRITQGNAGPAKFDDQALDSPETRVVLSVRFTTDPEDLAAVALLLRVLRDLRDPERRRLWAGSQTTRGYGLIREAVFKRIEGSFHSSLQDQLPDGWALEGESRPGRTRFLVYPNQETTAFDTLCQQFDSDWQAVRGRSVPA